MKAVGMTPFSHILIALQDVKAVTELDLATVLTDIWGGVCWAQQ